MLFERRDTADFRFQDNAKGQFDRASVESPATSIALHLQEFPWIQQQEIDFRKSQWGDEALWRDPAQSSSNAH